MVGCRVVAIDVARGGSTLVLFGGEEERVAGVERREVVEVAVEFLCWSC